MAQADGPAALLTGVAPTVVGYGLEGACKFGVYEALKPASAPLLASLGLGADQSAAAGPVAAAVVAGGLASLVLAPAEATRIRMVSEPSYASLGLLGAASRLYEAEGTHAHALTHTRTHTRTHTAHPRARPCTLNAVGLPS